MVLLDPPLRPALQSSSTGNRSGKSRAKFHRPRGGTQTPRPGSCTGSVSRPPPGAIVGVLAVGSCLDEVAGLQLVDRPAHYTTPSAIASLKEINPLWAGE